MVDALYVIEHHRGPSWADGVEYREQPGIEVHIGFMRSLDERGLMVLGGPFLDARDGTAVGMAIVRAESLDAAQSLAAEDPSIAGGLIRPVVRPWLVPMGTARNAE